MSTASFEDAESNFIVAAITSADGFQSRECVSLKEYTLLHCLHLTAFHFPSARDSPQLKI